MNFGQIDYRQIIWPALLGVGLGLVVFLLYSYRVEIITYLRETRTELGRVSWPTRREATDLTIIVLITITVSAIVLGLFDAVFTLVFAQLI
ncbi:MAG: SecE/Sec61-gamma subunit of protein translocation complex [Chloroflexota bacterium]|jgi:preprotein translocase subunit SecE|nr:MAG: preprotein translocase subunit SecE [Chloroflexota bacterium]RLT47562.1 MAG: preprotein translocase subunit SecE [Chloroflexota bacterium]RLT52774.1 MAG: preprotein translocase subunit SecE [Chloroflexota bacterium]